MKLKKQIYTICSLFIGIVLLIGAHFYLNKPQIEFKDQNIKIEIESEFDAYSLISKVNGYDLKDVNIDASQLDIHKLGQYEIIYKLDEQEYTLSVEVVDTVAPVYDIQDIQIYLGEEVQLDKVISNIKDSTKTKSYFKNNYDFTKVGTYDAIIIVEDEAGNKTEKNIQIDVIKDEEKPTLIGLKDITIYVGDEIDYLKNVVAKDNYDPHPTISVDYSQVNTNKVGRYELTYTVKDNSGNKKDYTVHVEVIKKKEIDKIPPNGNKVVYLTFDDGPSANTAKVLDILAKYNAKATFFVTGSSQKYNYLIKRAHNEGHTIGLHTYSHEYSEIYKSTSAYFKDLNKIGQMVKNEIGFVPRYIRFPGGASNTISANYCPGIMSVLTQEVQNRGYQYYDWNVSSGDASGNNVAVNKIIRSSTQSKAENIMLLAHDTGAKSTTVQALPEIIEHYQNLGYVFKAIDDNSFTPHHGVNN